MALNKNEPVTRSEFNQAMERIDKRIAGLQDDVSSLGVQFEEFDSKLDLILENILPTVQRVEDHEERLTTLEKKAIFPVR